MTNSALNRRDTGSRQITGLSRDRLRQIAEAGAKGRSLTPTETRAVCEALQAQTQLVRNQFHSGQ